MQTTEEKYDRLLHIKTTGRDDSHSDQYRFPYEPTPYPVLERLANAGYIRKGVHGKSVVPCQFPRSMR